MPNADLDNTIMELKSDLEGLDDEEAGEKIKSWIEKS